MEKNIWTNKKECRRMDTVLQNKYDILVFDLETTGLSAEDDRIVQFSAIRLRKTDKAGTETMFGYEEIDSIDLYIKPPFLMDQKVIDKHHITNEFLADKPDEVSVVTQIVDFFRKGPAVLSGYNISKFDVKFMNRMMKRNNIDIEFPTEKNLDVYLLAQDIVQRSKEIPSLTLENLSILYGLTNGDETFHSAIVDVRMTAKLLFTLYQEYRSIPFYDIKDLLQPKIQSITKFQKSKYVNYVYVDFKAYDGDMVYVSGRVHFDIWKNCWVEDIPGIFQKVNMYALERLSEELIISKGYKKISTFKGEIKTA